MTFFSVAVILFLIMDSFGNITYVWDILQNEDIKASRRILVREMLIALFTMLLFYFIGDILMKQLDISETTVRIASGTIMFLFAVKILFPTLPSVRGGLKVEGEPFLVPIAIPYIAGPSLLATIMLYAHDPILSKMLLVAIFAAWALSLIVLSFGPFLNRILGKNGLVAIERLLAMVLVMLAIQRFLEGVRLFVQAYAPH